jgi:hypothetical protein
METSLSVNVFEYMDDAITESLELLNTDGQEIDVGRWQGVPTEGKPDLVTKEIINLQWSAQMPESMEEAQELIMPNLPWAEDHFQERVAGEPTNPGEQYKNWPWWRGQVELTDAAMEPTYDESGTKQLTNFKFSHTYQERYWPKHAGNVHPGEGINLGVRYSYGDLNDVVGHLSENPLSRQGTFPIFFPEDTGVKHGGRVPCSLHYHFMQRAGKLHLWYPIRSCDAVRHFRDDVYMTVRLAQYVLSRLEDSSEAWLGVEMGYLNFNAYSFHAHKGDLHG